MFLVDLLKKGDPPLRLLVISVLAGLVILAVGLFRVQVVSGQDYRASQVNQSFRTVRLPAIRGGIYDLNGVPLAENRPAYNVNLYLEELRIYFQQTYRQRTAGQRLSAAARAELGRQVRYDVVSNLVARTAEVLQKPLELEARVFHRHYNERLALPLTIAADLSLSEVARFVELATGLPGLELEVQPMRHYPQRRLAAHTLGYLRRDDHPPGEEYLPRYSLPDFKGVAGIEGAFDDSLRGRPGLKSVLVNNLGYRHAETVWERAEAGNNIHLTLDLRVQRTAEAALHSLGPNTRGAVVVMDVRSGDLLALASAPAFDPNDFVPRITHDKWNLLLDTELTPQLNRATTGIYAPGSIFKVVIALAALESGIVDPARLYHSPGYYLLGSGPRARKIKDTARGGQPANFDFRDAFKLSSNAYFVHYGLLTGLDDIVAIGQRLHLGERTGLPLPAGQESAGDFPTPAWRAERRKGAWFEGDTANLSIGQGYITVTPVQMAVMTAAVANGGTVLWPRLVDRVEPHVSEPGHRTIRFPPGRARNHLGVSARTLDLVQQAMLADVEDKDGTGRRARISGYRLGAKTGTAQVPRRGRMDYVTWFVAYGPFEDPQHAVVVMVESGQSGGETCAPLARQVFEELRAWSSPEVAQRRAN
jgi:penicillin-binding protein 2